MQYVFKATPCSTMDGTPGYMVKQVRPDGSIATEGWQPNLDNLQELGMPVEVADSNGVFVAPKRADLHLLHTLKG